MSGDPTTKALNKMIGNSSQNSHQAFFSGPQGHHLNKEQSDPSQMTEPMRFNEALNVYEINMKNRDEAKWVQVLVLLAKGVYSSASYNAD